MKFSKTTLQSPAFVMRAVISVFLLISLICFFFPLVTFQLNNDNTLVGIVDWIVDLFGGEMPKPRHLSGIQLILAFTETDTIDEALNIGPLPCNAYVLISFLCTVLAVVMLWCSWKRPWHVLVSSAASFVSAISMIIFKPRFVGYYTAYTKNGGDRFHNLFEDSRMVLLTEPALIVAIIFLCLAFMVSFMFYFNAKNDPFFRGE